MPEKNNKSKPTYKAKIAGDEGYLRQVANTLRQKGEFENLHFEYLTDLLLDLGIKTNPYENMSTYGNNTELIEKIAEDSYLLLQNPQKPSLIKAKLERL